MSNFDKKPAHPYKINIDGNIFEFAVPEVTREQILNKAGKSPAACFSLYQKLEGCDFELVRPDEVVDLTQNGIERFTIKEPIVFNYLVDGEEESTDNSQHTPTEILQRAGINPNKRYLVQVVPGRPDISYAFQPTAIIKMVCKGMVFITREWLEEVNIEDFGKNCLEVPPAHRYRVKLQNQYVVFTSPYTTGKDLIIQSGKPDYTDYELYAFYSNNPTPQKIGYDQDVDLTERCLLRFVRQPKQQTEGRGNRQQFALPEGEIELLENRGLHWETLVDGNQHWVILYDYPVPEGYNVKSATVALCIQPGYPAAEIDMAYFYPALNRLDGKPIPALCQVTIDGLIYQRWSRHRKAGDWQPGVDNVITHLLLVDNWLTREFKVRP